MQCPGCIPFLFGAKMMNERSDRERGIASGEAPPRDRGKAEGESFPSSALAIASPVGSVERAEAARRSDLDYDVMNDDEVLVAACGSRHSCEDAESPCPYCGVLDWRYE